MSNSYASNPTLHLKQSQEFWSIEVQLFQECTLQGNCGDSSEFILDLKQKIKCNTIKWWLELSALVNFCIALQKICIDVCCNKVLPTYLALAWIVSAISVKECKKCSCQNYFLTILLTCNTLTTKRIFCKFTFTIYWLWLCSYVK